MYCPEPFEHFEVKGNGDVHICCPGVVVQPIGNLLATPVQEIWNSDAAKAIRQSVVDKTYAYCNAKHCALVRQFMDHPGEVVLKSDHRIEMGKGPALYNLGYDRACNLACRSCRTRFVGHKDIPDAHKKLSAKIQAKLLEFGFRDAKRLVVTGSGDPFASKFFTELFDEIDFRLCPDLKIRIFTNAMLLNQERWDRLKVRHAIDEIFISIDAATKETYEYLRRGGNFDTLMKRLNFIGRLKKSRMIKRFRISFVVQKDNYLEMERFVDIGDAIDADIIYFSAIRNWGSFKDEEFKIVAVHEPEHPNHNHLISILANKCFDNPKVNLNTLKYFRT